MQGVPGKRCWILFPFLALIRGACRKVTQSQSRRVTECGDKKKQFENNTLRSSMKSHLTAVLIVKPTADKGESAAVRTDFVSSKCACFFWDVTKESKRTVLIASHHRFSSSQVEASCHNHDHHHRHFGPHWCYHSNTMLVTYF